MIWAAKPGNPALLASSWQPTVSPVTNNLTSVTYGNGVYVASGNTTGSAGVIITSANGINWVQRTPATATLLNGILFDGTRFISYGTDICTSPDGKTWTLVTAGINVTGLTYGGGLYVCCSTSGYGGHTLYGSVLSSLTYSPSILLTFGCPLALCYGNGQFWGVTGGWSTNVYACVIYSTNGYTWYNNYNTGAGNYASYLWGIAYGSGVRIYCGTESGTYATLFDKNNNQIVMSPDYRNKVNNISLKFINGKFIAVYASSNFTPYYTNILQSSNGSTWTQTYLANYIYLDVACSTTEYVMVGKGGITCVSI